MAKRARQSLQAAAHYQEAEGYYALREAIASHIGITRGVRCAPEQVLLTAGSQGALDLAARVLLDPGDTAWIEDPGYLGARSWRAPYECYSMPGVLPHNHLTK